MCFTSMSRVRETSRRSSMTAFPSWLGVWMLGTTIITSNSVHINKKTRADGDRLPKNGSGLGTMHLKLANCLQPIRTLIKHVLSVQIWRGTYYKEHIGSKKTSKSLSPNTSEWRWVRRKTTKQIRKFTFNLGSSSSDDGA